MSDMLKIGLDTNCFDIQNLQLFKILEQLENQGKVIRYIDWKTRQEWLNVLLSGSEEAKSKIRATRGVAIENAIHIEQFDFDQDTIYRLVDELRLIINPNAKNKFNLLNDNEVDKFIKRHEKIESDPTILAYHILNKTDIFFTNDDDFLSKRQIIEEKYPLKILKFSESTVASVC